MDGPEAVIGFLGMNEVWNLVSMGGAGSSISEKRLTVVVHNKVTPLR